MEQEFFIFNINSQGPNVVNNANPANVTYDMN